VLARIRSSQKEIGHKDFPALAGAVDEYYSVQLPVVRKVMSIASVYPTQTAVIERYISVMNAIKTAGRSCLGDTLKDLMEIFINGPPLSEWDPAPAVALFQSGRRHTCPR